VAIAPVARPTTAAAGAPLGATSAWCGRYRVSSSPSRRGSSRSPDR
jgi:hypothetical protein